MSGYRSKAPFERKLGRAIFKSLPLLLFVLWALFLVEAVVPKIKEIFARVEGDVVATLNQPYGGE